LAAGGGIRNTGTLMVASSTISGNSANRNGGGIHNDGRPGAQSVNITNSTITDNRADNNGDNQGSGGGVSNGRDRGSVALRNTIVAGKFEGGSATTTRGDADGAVEGKLANNRIR